MTAVELARALRSRQTSASQVVEAALRRTRELNPALNAFALIDDEAPALRLGRPTNNLPRASISAHCTAYPWR